MSFQNHSSRRTLVVRPPFLLLLLSCFLLCISPAIAFSELRGKHLQACVLLEKPYVVRDNTRRVGFSGLAVDYLDRLRDNLEFSLEYRHWNDTWTNFIDIMATCNSSQCPCDVGIGSFTMTNSRTEQINFVWPFASEAHQMVSRRSSLRVDDSKNAWFVFRTFDLVVWMLVFSLVLLHAIGTWFYSDTFLISDDFFIEKDVLPPSSSSIPSQPPTSSSLNFENSSPSLIITGTRRTRNNFLTYISRVPSGILYAYAHLLGYTDHLEVEREETASLPSIHRHAWLIMGMTTGIFLLTIYESSLTILMFESTKVSEFKTLADLTECRIDPSKVAIIRGGASQDFWNSAVNTSRNRAKCNWRRAGVTVDNLEDGFAAVRDGGVDFFYSLEGSVRFRANGDCQNFVAVGEPFFSTSVGFVMPKSVNQTLLKILNRETRILIEENANPSARVLAKRNECAPENDPQIRVGKLSAFFLLYIVFWASLVVFRFIVLYRRRKKERATQNSLK